MTSPPPSQSPSKLDDIKRRQPLRRMLIGSAAEDIDWLIERVERLEELEQHCKLFVKEQRIRSSESIYQVDRVIANAYDFIEGVCMVVGYYEDPSAGEITT